MTTGDDITSSNRRRATAGTTAFVLLGVAMAIGAFLFVRPDRSASERVEAEHSIALPPSATDVQALGDASRSIVAVVGLDRGASSVMVIDREDVAALLDEFGLEPDDRFKEVGPSPTCGSATSPAPGNQIYQPTRVPWGSDAKPEARFRTMTPPGSADFACLFLYPVDDPNHAGAWLYSDWN